MRYRRRYGRRITDAMVVARLRAHHDARPTLAAVKDAWYVLRVEHCGNSWQRYNCGVRNWALRNGLSTARAERILRAVMGTP